MGRREWRVGEKAGRPGRYGCWTSFRFHVVVGEARVSVEEWVDRLEVYLKGRLFWIY